MQTSFERLLAKQQELTRKIKAAERKQASVRALVAAKRQQKLGRLLEAWLQEDAQLAQRALGRLGKERWSKEDQGWLQGLAQRGAP